MTAWIGGQPMGAPTRAPEPGSRLEPALPGEDTSAGDRRRRQAGMLLVEVTVAMAVLAVLAVAALLVMIPVGQQARVNRELTTAAASVRNVIEEIQSTAFNDVLVAYPDDTSVNVDELPSGLITITYEDTTTDPLVVQLEASWNSVQGNVMTRNYVTVKTE